MQSGLSTEIHFMETNEDIEVIDVHNEQLSTSVLDVPDSNKLNSNFTSNTCPCKENIQDSFDAKLNNIFGKQVSLFNFGNNFFNLPRGVTKEYCNINNVNIEILIIHHLFNVLFRIQIKKFYFWILRIK